MSQEAEAASARIRRLAAEIRSGGQPVRAAEGSGRGLVVVAGGSRIFTNAYVLLHMLRHALGSSLPVELWYFGQSEISPAMAAAVEPLDVRLVDATPLIAASGVNIRDGWQLKAFALVHSRFAEVLLLDADQVPVSDPEACFDWPQYAETGAVFWPDILDLRPDNPIWSLLGLEGRRTVSFESGQLLVDRRRHAPALAAALQLNVAADDVYQLIYGDKDTFLLAWEMLGAPYALVPHRPYADDYMLVQRDFAGSALFQHRTNAKWQYAGDQRKLSGFRYEPECLAALAELQRRWSGQVFTPPDRGAEAREIEQQLIGSRSFVLEVVDEPPFTVTLQPHGEIGEGRAADRRHWWVEVEAGKPRLIFAAGDQQCYVLDRGDDHIWLGRRLRLPAGEVSLIPAGSVTPVSRADRPGLVDDLLRAGGVYGGAGEPGQPLADALALLAEVVPGVRARIEHLARTQSDAVIADRLQALAAGLGERSAMPAVVRSPAFQTGYIRSEMPG